jgi:hypothetical protein
MASPRVGTPDRGYAELCLCTESPDLSALAHHPPDNTALRTNAAFPQAAIFVPPAKDRFGPTA